MSIKKFLLPVCIVGAIVTVSTLTFSSAATYQSYLGYDTYSTGTYDTLKKLFEDQYLPQLLKDAKDQNISEKQSINNFIATLENRFIKTDPTDTENRMVLEITADIAKEYVQRYTDIEIKTTSLPLCSINPAMKQVTDKQGNTYVAGQEWGYNSRDSVVIKRDASGKTIWKNIYSATYADERAEIVTLDNQGNPWVVFTLDGGSDDKNYITKKWVEKGAFTDVFLPDFGRARWIAKVSIVTKLNPTNGKIVKGTYIMSRTNTGNIYTTDWTNSAVIQDIYVTGGSVILDGWFWYLPPSVTATKDMFTFHANATKINKIGNSWKVRLSLPTDLSKLLTSEVLTTSNCQMPEDVTETINNNWTLSNYYFNQPEGIKRAADAYNEMLKKKLKKKK